jgi:apolipoprotein N-acyltransferase
MKLVQGFPANLRDSRVTLADRAVRGKKMTRSRAATQIEPATANSRLLVCAAMCASGLCISIAWFVTETIASALLGWISVALLIYGVRARRAYLPAFCCGIVVHAVGFYWIYGTVADFGGFGLVISGLIFGLYVASGAVQFLVFAFVHHNLGSTFDAYCLRSPTAIVVSELVTIRVFHWHFGHTQIAFTPFVQIAGIGGAMLVSFVMFWLAEAGVRILVSREWRPVFLLPVATLVLSLAYGDSMTDAFASNPGEKQEVVLVQGPPSLAEKRDIDSIWKNLARLHDLSRETPHKGALIVWPEGSIPAYIPADLGSVHKEPDLPWLGDGSAFLVGGFSVDGNKERYNAAFAVYPDGTVPAPYFKRILIPFGEYMPFSSVFPALNDLNANAGLFSSGKVLKVFSYPMCRRDGTEYTAKVAPLICYEDTLTEPARDATRQGAELLVNLTYDTWFGRSAAPYQHHLIAAFRAIENRRFLVRSTYTGYTAVVNPLGKTIAHIPCFTEGKLTVNVPLLKGRSIYTNYVGETPWWALTALSAGLIVVKRLTKAKAPSEPV